METSALLAIPRELREEIFQWLTLPATVYTSSAQTSTHSLHTKGFRKPEETFVDTRIYLPSRPPANVLLTCKQLRQEYLELHSHLLNSSAANGLMRATSELSSDTQRLERSDTELDEAAEQASDDGVTLRLTLEIQRPKRNAFGFSAPVRENLSPQFLALLPLMRDARRLKLIVWPGFDWWNGPMQASPLETWRQRKALLQGTKASQNDVERQSESEAIESSKVDLKPDALTIAIGRILHQLPAIEELDLTVFIATGDLFRWDLPEVKWGKIQPWLDAPISKTVGQHLRSVSTTLTSVWQWPESEIASQQPFYVQKETRSDVANKWRVVRQGGWRAPALEHLAQLAALELPDTCVDETFERVDA